MDVSSDKRFSLWATVVHALVAGCLFAQLTLQARYLSRQYSDDVNQQPVADCVVVDASLRKRVASWTELFVDGENLTDRRYIAAQTGGLKILGQPLFILGGLRIDL